MSPPPPENLDPGPEQVAGRKEGGPEKNQPPSHRTDLGEGGSSPAPRSSLARQLREGVGGGLVPLPSPLGQRDRGARERERAHSVSHAAENPCPTDWIHLEVHGTSQKTQYIICTLHHFEQHPPYPRGHTCLLNKIELYQVQISCLDIFYKGEIKSEFKSGVALKEKSLQERQGHPIVLPWKLRPYLGATLSMAAPTQ